MNFRKNSVWVQKVNFMLSVALIGATALLGIIAVLEVAEEPNPITEIFLVTVYAGE